MAVPDTAASVIPADWFTDDKSLLYSYGVLGGNRLTQSNKLNLDCTSKGIIFTIKRIFRAVNSIRNSWFLFFRLGQGVTEA